MGKKCPKVGYLTFFFTLTKRSSFHGLTKFAKVGPPWARVKSAKVAPTPYVYYPRVFVTFTTPFQDLAIFVFRVSSKRTILPYTL